MIFVPYSDLVTQHTLRIGTLPQLTLFVESRITTLG